jgi:VWFA-related protein
LLFTPLERSLIFVGLVAGTACAQQSATFHTNVEIVVVPCSVVDAKDAPVTDMSRDEFRVFDNGVPRPVRSLWIDTDLPLTLGVIIDTSESQQDRFSEHRKTAADLIERILRPGDRAFVISAAEQVRRWVDMTESAAEIKTKLDGEIGDAISHACCAASAIWDSIYDAARFVLQPLKGNKALLVLTDGIDAGSAHRWNEAANAANAAGAAVYVIQYRSDFGGSLAPDLFRLIGETGGTGFAPPKGDYRTIVSRLEADMRQRYVVGFWPEKLSGKIRHEIRVEVTRPDVTVRAPKTYLATVPAQ